MSEGAGRRALVLAHDGDEHRERLLRDSRRRVPVDTEPICKRGDASRLREVDILIAGETRPLAEPLSPLERNEDVELLGLDQGHRA